MCFFFANLMCFFAFSENNNNKRLRIVHIAVILKSLKRLSVTFITIILLGSSVFPQETVYGPGFRTMLMNNPAFAGISGDGILKLSYMNFYPGNSYNLHSFYTSYDSYFEPLHGGAGIWIADDYLGGIINDTRGALSYAYFLQAGKDLFINAGLSAGVYSRGLSFGNAVLPDMIDPLGGVAYPTGETLIPSSRMVFDVNAGFVFIYRSFFAGLSLNHLSQPDMSAGTAVERLKRRLFLNAAGSIILSESSSAALRPAGFLEIQGDHVAAGAGSSVEFNAMAFNVILMGNNHNILDMQAGFSLKSGRAGIFYAYRFNLVSGNSLMPLSLLHQAGLTFSLNSVDKRSNSGTISLPDL